MSSTSDSKKRAAVIGGSVGAIAMLIGMLALFSKGCGSADGEPAAPTAEEAAASVSDAEMMGLKGPVERVETWFEEAEQPFMTANFNVDGNLIVPDGITIERDDMGRLTKYANKVDPDSENSFTYEVRYDGDDMRPVGWSSSDIGSNGYTELKFSAEGDLTTASETANLEGEKDEYSATIAYTILNRDEHGNWTKRQADVEETYGSESAPTCRTYVETRKITYHK